MTESIDSQLEGALSEIPMLDAHSHIVESRPSARGLHDILLYHMVVSDLYAAGCPSGARLTEYPSWPGREEAEFRVTEALPYLPRIRNTSTMWALRIALEALYGWREPLTGENWRALDDLIRERADDTAHAHSVLDRAGIDRVATEYARRGDAGPGGRFQYALEWGFFTRTQWGEFDTPLYELERCWGQPVGSPAPIGSGKRVDPDMRIETVADVHEALEYYVDAIPYDEIIALTSHFSTDIDYSEATDSGMEDALARRESAGERERDVYASYINETFLTALERCGRQTLFQFSLGAEPLPHETGSRLSDRTIAQLGEMFARHPAIEFQCFLASRHANQALCTLARELPNLSLIGYWWHNFFPETIRHVIGERLDMLPLNRQVGFFSDAYCVEWAYAKASVVRRQLAHVLAGRVRQRQYTIDDAVAIAREILWETPQTLNGMRPWARPPQPIDR